MTDDKSLNFSQKKKKIGGCPAESSYCMPDIEISSILDESMTFTEFTLNSRDKTDSISLSELKMVFLAEVPFKPINLSNIPEKELIKQIYDKSVSDLYYFCWRYSFRNDDLIPMIKLSNYKKPGLLHSSVEFLSRIVVEGNVYNLLGHPGVFKGAKHSNPVYPYNSTKTRNGQEIYDELKNWGFIEDLVRFTKTKSNCFASEQDFEACFQDQRKLAKLQKERRKGSASVK